jgi:hypothetical protein
MFSENVLLPDLHTGQPQLGLKAEATGNRVI